MAAVAVIVRELVFNYVPKGDIKKNKIVIYVYYFCQSESEVGRMRHAHDCFPTIAHFFGRNLLVDSS